MNGEPANPRQSGYIISSWSRMEVKGWRKSLDDVAAFYFTTLGDSYAGRTGRPANVGVIGVALFQRKHYEPPPEAAADPSPYRMQPYARERSDAKRENYNEEQRAPKLAQDSAGVATTPAPAASAPLGTGHGRREESRMQWVAFDRSTDTPVETIAIYYDSYRNLVAQGVLQQPMGRRDPNPFPTGFTPDP
jgi:hypothetical protein